MDFNEYVFQYMQIAFNLAKRHNGLTGSNPSVGCVIVKDQKLISFGITDIMGRPHAEQVALSKNKDCKGADLFVTLEPCNHHGKTSPCTESIIQNQIKRVFIGIHDADHRVNGQGVKALEKAGIEVFCNIMSSEIHEFYNPYLSAKTFKRPFVTAKIVCSLDGKIATKTGDSKWISSPKVRLFTNYLRHKYDGILIGGETYRKDLPSLTCRIEGLEDFSPKKFILSNSLRQVNGFEILNGKPSQILEKIYNVFHINQLLIEGGANIISSFIGENLINELMVIHSPLIIGCDGKDCTTLTSILKISEAYNLTLYKTLELDGNIINFYRKNDFCIY
jgi:diaminohydroxyphosphoribosylaminopyrimidine deaminase/5-amino-6-(5-phosphoribosylamino)uracil reductase